MKKLVMLLIVLAGMVLCQGCIDEEEVAKKLEYQKEIDAANAKIRLNQKEFDAANAKIRANQPAKEKDLTNDAWCIAQQFIEQRLKCPRTAKWTWGGHTKATTNLGNNRYRYAHYVDSQNSFGAMIRTHFVCIVKYTGGEKWRLESLTF